MATAEQQQETAARRVSHLPANQIVCRFCGEQSASGSSKGYAHLYGPTLHRFMAKAADVPAPCSVLDAGPL